MKDDKELMDENVLNKEADEMLSNNKGDDDNE